MITACHSTLSTHYSLHWWRQSYSDSLRDFLVTDVCSRNFSMAKMALFPIRTIPTIFAQTKFPLSLPLPFPVFSLFSSICCLFSTYSSSHSSSIFLPSPFILSLLSHFHLLTIFSPGKRAASTALCEYCSGSAMLRCFSSLLLHGL